MRKAKIISMLLIMTIAFSLTACTGLTTPSNSTDSEPSNEASTDNNKNEQKKTIPTIRFVHQDTPSSEEMKIITDKLDDYAESVKDRYKLVQEVVAGDELKSKVRIDMASNNLGDILWFWGHAADASELASNDLVIEVDEYFEASDKLSREQFNPNLWDGLTINGKNYCIPVDNLEANWIVNKDLFDKYGLEYPKTYQDIIKLAETFAPEGIITLGMGSKGGNPAHFFLDMIHIQYDGARQELLNLGNTWNLDTENFRKSLNLVKDLIDADALPEDTIANGDWGPYFALFSEGKAAVTWGWAGMIAGLPDNINYEFIDPPKVEGTDFDTSNMSIACSSAGVLINKKSFNDESKKAAIVDFVDWYLGEDFMLTTFYHDGVIPTRVNIEYDKSKVDPAVAEIVDRNAGKEVYLTHMSTIPNANVWVDYQSGLDEFFAGSMTVDEYIDYIQNSMDQNKPQ